MSRKTMVIIAGPTAVGKTGLAIDVAKMLNTEIINADSRQIYREMVIGTAVPNEVQQKQVKHHFINHKSIHENYNASVFESEVLDFLNIFFSGHNEVVMTGGSGMYIDAVCRGIDDIPTVDPEIRNRIRLEYEATGLEGIRLKLKHLDPEYYRKVDLKNPVRIMKAIEIAEMTGRPYSAFLTGTPKTRAFSTVKIGLDLPRQELHERINRRVDLMMKQGLLEEVRALYPYKHLNPLNTVGYKELFGYLDKRHTLDEAVEMIKGHTRQYARRQLTWFHRDKEMKWFRPDEKEMIFDYILHPDGVGVPRRGVL
ncbi:MAG: tRNA (adenosine(37)-N6)-dimethylallyltransferase MiaA [Bacteroidales bacterium]|nr:tRNA (adenosine(37)-N6)-dimethylallyltransferase MiaA [Bacteroidales bacterium]